MRGEEAAGAFVCQNWPPVRELVPTRAQVTRFVELRTTTGWEALPKMRKANFPPGNQSGESNCNREISTDRFQDTVWRRRLVGSFRTRAVGSWTAALMTWLPLPSAEGERVRLVFVAPGSATLLVYH